MSWLVTLHTSNTLDSSSELVSSEAYLLVYQRHDINKTSKVLGRPCSLPFRV